jgi:hypothetical protein
MLQRTLSKRKAFTFNFNFNLNLNLNLNLNFRGQKAGLRRVLVERGEIFDAA